MTEAVIAVVALVVGLLLGFFLGGRSTGAQKASQEEKARQDAAALDAARAELARVQAESARRAGFEALAAERQASLERLTAERDAVRNELNAASQDGNTRAARISELETLLASEQKKTEEKIALLDEAKTKLAAQFEVLANNILEKKSEKFSEGSQKEIGTLLNPLKTQIEEFRKKVEEAQTDSKTGVAELRGMIGNLDSLNKALAEEARNLTIRTSRLGKGAGRLG